MSSNLIRATMEITTTETVAETVWGTTTTPLTGGAVTIDSNYYAHLYDIVELRRQAVDVLLNKADRCSSLGLEAMDDALPIADDGKYAAPTAVHTDTFLIHLFDLADKLVEYYITGVKPKVIDDIVT